MTKLGIIASNPYSYVLWIALQTSNMFKMSLKLIP